MKKRFGGVLVAASIAALTLLVPASASASGTLRVVDDDGLAGLLDDGGPDCTDGFTPALLPGVVFATIGAAVAAASPGDHVYVCPGWYNETVAVSKSITIDGPYKGVTDRKCVARSGQAVVTGNGGPAFDIQADSVKINGLRIANSSLGGVLTHAAYSGATILNNQFDHDSLGIDLASSGAIKTSILRNCFDDDNIGGAGYGIRSNSGGASQVDIGYNGFRNHRQAAILLDGTALPVGQTSIFSNVSTEDRAFLTLTTVSNVLVQDNAVFGSDEVSNPASAIVVGGASTAVQVLTNTIDSEHLEGVRVKDTASGVVVTRNDITSVGDGISVSTTAVGGVNVRFNRIHDVTGFGLTFAATTSGDTIVGNRALGIASFHCSDLSVGTGTDGTANSWSNDVGLYSAPSKICRAH